MNIVLIFRIYLFFKGFDILLIFTKSTQCSPKVSPCGAIFRSILPVNIAYYSSLPKTLKPTPPELVRNTGQVSSAYGCDSIDLRFTLSAVVLYLHRFWFSRIVYFQFFKKVFL